MSIRFRRRPIIPDKKLQVVRSDGDLVFQDANGTEHTVSRAEIEAANSELDATVVKPKRFDLPIPEVTTVATYEQDNAPDFQPPVAYVHFPGMPPQRDEYNEDEIEYNADAEDEQWLSSHPKYGRKAAASHRLPIQVFEHMIDTLEKEDAISGTMPSDEQAKTAFHTRIQDFSKYAGGSSTNRLVTDVRQYWATKRQKLRRPLIRRFWPEVQTDANDPHVAFKPRTRPGYGLRKHRKNDMEAYQKMKLLRQDLMRTRELIDLVKRREKLKRELFDLAIDTFEQQLHEMCAPASNVRTPRTLQHRESLLTPFQPATFTRMVDTFGEEEEIVDDDGLGGDDGFDDDDGADEDDMEMMRQAAAERKRMKKSSDRRKVARKRDTAAKLQLDMQERLLAPTGSSGSTSFGLGVGSWWGPPEERVGENDEGPEVLHTADPLGLCAAYMVAPESLAAEHSRQSADVGLGFPDRASRRPTRRDTTHTSTTPALHSILGVGRTDDSFRSRAGSLRAWERAAGMVVGIGGSSTRPWQFDLVWPRKQQFAPSICDQDESDSDFLASDVEHLADSMRDASVTGPGSEDEMASGEAAPSAVSAKDMVASAGWRHARRSALKRKRAGDFICRPRLGRGGRVVIDRVTVTPTWRPAVLAASQALRRRSHYRRKFETHLDGRTSPSCTFGESTKSGVAHCETMLRMASGSNRISLLDRASFTQDKAFGQPTIELQPRDRDGPNNTAQTRRSSAGHAGGGGGGSYDSGRGQFVSAHTLSSVDKTAVTGFSAGVPLPSPLPPQDAALLTPLHVPHAGTVSLKSDAPIASLKKLSEALQMSDSEDESLSRDAGLIRHRRLPFDIRLGNGIPPAAS